MLRTNVVRTSDSFSAVSMITVNPRHLRLLPPFSSFDVGGGKSGTHHIETWNSPAPTGTARFLTFYAINNRF